MPNFLDGFAFNYNSLIMLESCLLWVISFFTFMIVKDKSKALKSFMLVLGSGIFMLIGYVFSQGYYEEIKWPRLLLLTVIPFQHIFTFLFFLYFPTEIQSKIPKFILVFLLFLVLPILGLLNYSALQTNMNFDYYGHFYEFNIPKILKLYAIIVLLTTLIIQISSLWRFFQLPKGDKKGTGWLSFAIFSGYIIPAILNLLNKTGVIDRGVYISFFSLATSIALFVWIIAFINHTDDRTTFLFKIVGVTFTTFIILFAIASAVILTEREKNYDELKNREWKVALFEPREFQDLKFIRTVTEENKQVEIFSREQFELDEFSKELLNKTYLCSKLLSFPNESEIHEENIEPHLLSKSSKFYWKYLYAKSPTNQKERIFETIPIVNKKFFQIQSKIREIPEENFKENFKPFFEKEKGNWLNATEVLEDVLSDQTKENAELKREVLLLFEPLILPKARWYGFSKDKTEKLVLFHYTQESKVYQFIYSYPYYRNYIHQGAMPIFYIVLFGTVLFVAGIPVFLFRALVKPLGALLTNVREVRKGNLNVETKIKVYDEIGYLSQSFNTMVEAIRESKAQLQEYAEKLEEKVKERTQELALSLAKVEELKTQQDGDYFLTTLLLKPFGLIEQQGSKIKLDFFIKQKKEFTFKNKTHQIGGDLCVSNKIQLKGRTYLVFLNADAMGKSMQGAGGILVLGSVFESIIQRTRHYPLYSEVSPEKWIKQSFKELHKIFETFDGSMLVSVIFGLVDDENGIVYYINAEHPWLILYRDGKASFIEEKTNFRKLGHSGLTGEIIVSTFAMQPGDLIIMGSDGKDDLVLSKEGDVRVINEDETLFLKNVEECEGDLDKIYKTICERYEIIDDFSLLSIYYSAEEKVEEKEIEEILQNVKSHIKRSSDLNKAIDILEPAYEKYQNKKILQMLIWCYQKSNQLKEACNAYRIYLQKNDAETDFLFNASLCFKKSREIEEAIELSERVKLREPQNIRNLLHLADMYIYTKNFKRARKLLNKILLFYEPENEKAKFLLDRLNEVN